MAAAAAAAAGLVFVFGLLANQFVTFWLLADINDMGCRNLAAQALQIIKNNVG